MNASKALISTACTVMLLTLATGCTTPRMQPETAPNNAPPDAGVATKPATEPGTSSDQKPAAGKSNTASNATATTAAGGTPAQPAFDQVIKGAERQEGLLPVWKKQEKVWLELSPKAFNRPFLLSPKLATGIGEAGVFGGLMQSRWSQVGRPQWVEFRKVHQQVQLLAVNAAFTAQPGTPQAKAVEQAYSPSLLASVPLASAPHAKHGAVLIDANALLAADLLGLAQQLQRSYRQSYALDGRNSALINTRTDDTVTVFEVNQHFATAVIAAPTPGPGPSSTAPVTLPDPRSLFIKVHLSVSALPEQPMATRAADPRVGYFTSTVTDFSDDLARTPRKRFINRWRLDKKDPQAALSEPVKPIVFWLDASIPEAYRPTITEGILAWNKAFEAIGFKNAIQVRTASADQPVDTLATGHASIRWMTNNQPSFGAIGPSHVDPRTGEILDADIALESLSSRSIRTVRSQILPTSSALHHADHENHDRAAAPESCQHGDLAAEQLGLALDVMEAQGLIDPDAPEVREFVLAYLKDVTMHEVGHTLGLRHNFRASRWHTAEQLNDPVLTREQGNTASVMDYSPINLPAPGQRAGTPFQATLGPYDYWAIEYGYKPLPADPQAARAQLREIAARSALPSQQEALAYGTDEDNILGIDPQALTFDLGRDPVAFARTRLAIVQDLFERQARRELKPDDDPTLLRRSVSYGLRELGRTSQTLLRQIGGVVTRRDAPGSGRALLDPLPAAQQRAALQVLMQDFLGPRSLALPPALLRRLAPDFMERQEGGDLSGAPVSTDFSLAEQQLALQRGIVNHLMNEALADRLLDNIDKTRDIEAQPLSVQELFQALRTAIWQDQQVPVEMASARRNLQREHVNRLASALVRGGSSRADVRALNRDQASSLLKALRTRLDKAQSEAGRSTRPGRAQAEGQMSAQGQADERVATLAHLQDCIDLLTRALEAPVVRATP